MDLDGLLLVNKPSGITSFDVIRRLRKITGQKKIGHAGTLDPMASGLMIMLVGAATKRAPEFVKLDKTYVAEITLGADYLNAGGVDHGYALTAHRAQGGTWDLAISVGADGLYREAAYPVLSRGRHENWLVLTAPELDALDAELSRHDSPTPLPGEWPSGSGRVRRGSSAPCRGERGLVL